MDAKITARKVIINRFKSSFLNFSINKNAVFIPGFMSAKVYLLFITGIYYNSQVTSLINSLATKLPDSINARISAARNFMKLDTESKFGVFRNFYFSKTLSNTTNEQEGQTSQAEVMNPNVMTEKVQSLTFSEYETSTVDAVDITFNDFKGLKEEIVEDVVAGFLGGLEKAGQKYLDLTFREKDVHKASIDLLNYAIKEESFVKESRIYGIELINDVVKDPQFQRDCKIMSLSVVRHDDVKKASVELLKHCVNHNTTQTYVKNLMKQVMTKTNTNDLLISTLCDAVLECVHSPETIKHLGRLFNKIGANEIVQAEAKNSLLYGNILNRMPFMGKSSNAKSDELSKALQEKITNWVNENQTI